LNQASAGQRGRWKSARPWPAELNWHQKGTGHCKSCRLADMIYVRTGLSI